jgi:hypothetical protein
MAQAFGDRLLEAEINPLFVLPRGQGVRAADGLVVLSAIHTRRADERDKPSGGNLPISDGHTSS